MCYLKFGALQPGATAGRQCTQLLNACEAFAHVRGMARVRTGVNMGCAEAYHQMRKSGFRTDIHGIAMQHLQGTVTAQASANDGSAAPPVTVKMEGIVDPTDLTANINIWINGTHYHLNTDNGSLSDAAAVVQQILPLLQAQNWNALYPYMADQIRAQYTQAQFAQSLNSQGGSGTTLVSLSTSGAGQASVNPLGYAYYQQPIAEQTRAADGSTTTATVNLYLVREDGAWHYASTDPAPNDPVGGAIDAGQS